MDIQLLAALLLGVAAVIVLIMWSRLDAFAALLIGAVVTGLVAGVPVAELIEQIGTGFGNTLGGIGIVIGLGVMIGKIMEQTGAADALARFFIRLAGKGREDVALTATGAAVSVPVFCDSGFVILHPLARSLARRYGRPLVLVSLALAGGLSVTHHLVPPTPGPLAAAGLLGVDLGQMIIAGLLFSLPLLPVVVLYARYMGPRLESQVDPSLVPGGAEDGPGAGGAADGGAEGAARTEPGGPALRTEAAAEAAPTMGAGRAGLPLLLPLVLIILNTIGEAVAPESTFAQFAAFIGSPTVALLIGLLVAVYLLPPAGTKRSTVTGWLTAAAASAGMIVFITGAGGAFGQVLRDSGVGDALAGAVSAWPLPLFLLPFLIATFVRLAQGSGTVAIITAATLAAPIVEVSALNPLVAALSACAGSFVFSYFNDSYFWVVTRFTGLSGAAAMKMWSGMTTVLWACSLPLLAVTALVLG
ncbi:GntP family permease [Allonocardiopsis opalescens]|uniref:GntP family gluconate:H+ symporter n=1 Tax=Allonocardiopsis opalescens TaxID=1144618 RepID=A0A2T0PW02_9ACTN|nr:SLC13 family permease [Allonocardiopsis opalescens]PRX95701.1 GntP family gluconate:H+ symporter [Allonocardiopsis opalescens]